MDKKVKQQVPHSLRQPVEKHETTRSKKGFANLEKGHLREIASKGGRAAHEKGTAHEFSSEEARSAGQKGGTTVSRDREHMAAIGRMGGAKRAPALRGVLPKC